MKNFLSKADHIISIFCRYSLIVLTLLLTSMMFITVFLRYVLDQSFPAIEELSILVGLWFYFISMAVVTREKSHLTGGILELFNISPKVLLIIQKSCDLVGLMILCAFSFYACKYLLFMMKINRVSTNLSWPTALWVSAAVAGFTLSCT